MDDREAGEALTNILQKVEKDLALPDRFVVDLIEESDWSFTIKAHALLEAAVTQTLILAIPDSRIHPLVESLNLAGRHSKLSYAEALQLLEDGHIRFLNQLSQIRNTIVHHISQIGFTYRDYLRGLDPDRRRNVLTGLLFMSGAKAAGAADQFEKHARVMIWAHVVVVLSHCIVQQTQVQSRAAIESRRRALAEAILQNIERPS